MKKYYNLYILLIIISLSVVEGCQQKQVPVNTLSKEEIKEGWQLLFDGKSTEHWRGYNKADFPDYGWTIEDDALFCQHSDMGEAGWGGDIITRKKYSDFELKLDWKVDKAANSGVFYLMNELPGEPGWHGAPELQILDGANFPLELQADQLSGSAYGLVAADPQTIKPYGEWNQIRIIHKDREVEHWQNGKEVVSFTIGTPEWKKMVLESKFSEYPEFLNMSKEGHIGLQDHGGGVWFRNIKIREL